MSAEHKSSQQINTEVIGVFSSAQEQEMKDLTVGLIDALQLNPKDPDHAIQLETIIWDSFNRGLDNQGIEWISKTASAAETFEIGFGLREQAAENLQKLAGDPLLQSERGLYLSVKEQHALSNTSVFDPHLSELESVGEDIGKRMTNVQKFHTILFSQTALKEDAQVLRQMTTPTYYLCEARTPESQNELVNHKLYTNLVINLINHNRPGLLVEAEDIALLHELWKSEEAKLRTQERIVAITTGAAERLEIDEDAIDIYTRNILSNLNEELSRTDIIRESVIREQNLFIPTQSTAEKDSELDKQKVAYFLPDDITDAEQEIKKLESAFQIMNDTKGSDDEVDAHYVEIYESQIKPVTSSISPLGLLMVQDTLANTETELSLFEGDYRFETILEAYSLLLSEDWIVEKSTNLEYWNPFTKVTIENLKDRFRAEIIRQVSPNTSESVEAFRITLDSLDTGMWDLIGKMNLKNLEEDKLSLFFQKSDEFWLRLLQSNGVKGDTIPGSDHIEAVFTESSGDLQYLFSELSEERRIKILNSLDATIEY